MNFAGLKKTEKDFADLIPQLIATKNTNSDDNSFIAKIRRNIARLVVVRRVDGKNPKEVDSVIVQTEKLLHEQNYQGALNALVALDQKYHNVLVNFLSELSNAVEVEKIDQEILSYLKSLG